MSRSYKGIRPNKHRVYSVSQTMALYGVCRNTLSNWIKQGILPTGGKGEQLFLGADLTRFHQERRDRIHLPLSPGEFKCFTCKAAVRPDNSRIQFKPHNLNCFLAKAHCPECNGPVQKFLNATERDALKNQSFPNTTLLPLHKLNSDALSRIGNIDRSEKRSLSLNNVENDRLIFRWQIFSECYSEKTMLAHLANIRAF
jgi:hypothetical protein